MSQFFKDTPPSSAIQDESTGISSTLVQDRQKLSRKRERQQSLVIDEESDEEIMVESEVCNNLDV